MGASASRPKVLVSLALLLVAVAFRRRKGRHQKSIGNEAVNGRKKPSQQSQAPSWPPPPNRPVPTAPPPPPSRPVPTAGSNGKAVFSPTDDPAVEVWICLDFEWTCDEGENPRVKSDEGEIIEFAFVVFDAVAHKAIGDGQHWVKNRRTPLTLRCTELTGITNATLADAGSLADALKKFMEVLASPEVAGRRCCACTHGPADLELLLPANCKDDGLQVPAVLRNYVDLREAAQHYVRSEGLHGLKASTLRQICEALQVEMIGTEHCGLDDSWMVLLALQQLLLHNASLETVDIDAEREAFLQQDVSSDAWSAKALCLDGLPNSVTAAELLEWLNDLTKGSVELSDLGIILGMDRRPSGRAVVGFSCAEDAVKALRTLDGGQRFVTNKRGPHERLILVRPLRRGEKAMLVNGIPQVCSEYPGVCAFPQDTTALDNMGVRSNRVPQMTAGTGYTGCLVKFLDDRGFGFINFNGAEVFVHASELQPDMRVGSKINFDVMMAQNGKPRATNVTRA